MARNFSKWFLLCLLTMALPGFAAPVLVAAKSRKVHASAGTLDVPIDIGLSVSGSISIEPREIGINHTVVFQFDGPVTSVSGVTMVDGAGTAIGSISAPAISGNDVSVVISSIPNSTRSTITLTGIDGAGTATVSMGFLNGDVDADGVVTQADVSAIKAQSARAANPGSAKLDLNTSGVINAVDIAIAKANLGFQLPTIGQASLMVSTTGTGAGQIVSTPAGIACPGACSANFASNATIQLVAAPAMGSTFTGWSGDCSGTNSTFSVGLSRSATCVAQFTVNTFLVTPSAGTNGTISPAIPQAIAFGSRANFTASPAAGFAATFGGTCGGSAGGNVYLTNPISTACTVTATFAPAVTTLTWDAVIDSRVSGYRVYFGTNPGSYQQVAGQGINVGNVTSYVLPALAGGFQYYFAVRAYDASGVESPYSNEASKYIP